MPKIFKQSDYEFKQDENALPQYKLLTAHPRLFQSAQSKNLVFDLRTLPPGKYSFPYHFHRNSEELMMIVSGSLTLRTPAGTQIVKTGEIMYFNTGEEEAHQFFNHSNEPCVYLDIRTIYGIDVSEYPDSGKVNIIPFNELYEQKSRVSYNSGEEDIEQIWNKLMTDGSAEKP
jgi:uncharacterized cupin superfamily protein